MSFRGLAHGFGSPEAARMDTPVIIAARRHLDCGPTEWLVSDLVVKSESGD